MPRARAIFSHVLSLPLISDKNDRLFEDDEVIKKEEVEAAAAVNNSASSFSKRKSTVVALQDFPSTSGSHSQIQMSFVSVDSGVSDAAALLARKDKELKALAYFEEHTRAKLTSMRSMHDWMFNQHGAYAANRLVLQQPQPQMDAVLLKSY